VTSVEKTFEHDVATAGAISLHKAQVGNVVFPAFTPESEPPAVAGGLRLLERHH